MSLRAVKHRRIVLSPQGGAGTSVATASLQTGPAIVRFLGIDYTSQAVTTDVTVKTLMTDGTTGTTIFTKTDNATDVPLSAVGMPGADETGAALAATDGSAGGLPVGSGLYFDVAQADASTGNKDIVVDVIYESCFYQRLDLVAQSGADGTGAVARHLQFNRAGVLRAIAIDYQNMPGATTDLVIKADVDDVDLSGGVTMLTKTDTATDVPLRPYGYAAIDEGGAATAATDATDGGFPFRKNLLINVTGADIFTGQNERILVDLWIDF